MSSLVTTTERQTAHHTSLFHKRQKPFLSLSKESSNTTKSVGDKEPKNLGEGWIEATMLREARGL